MSQYVHPISWFIRAFLPACIVAAIFIMLQSFAWSASLGIQGTDFAWLPIQLIVLTIIILSYTLLPVLLILRSARKSTVRRGLPDSIVGGLLGLPPALFLSQGILASMFWENVLMFSGSGMIAGFAYWVFAGKPRPPYSQA